MSSTPRPSRDRRRQVAAVATAAVTAVTTAAVTAGPGAALIGHISVNHNESVLRLVGIISVNHNETVLRP